MGITCDFGFERNLDDKLYCSLNPPPSASFGIAKGEGSCYRSCPSGVCNVRFSVTIGLVSWGGPLADSHFRPDPQNKELQVSPLGAKSRAHSPRQRREVLPKTRDALAVLRGLPFVWSSNSLSQPRHPLRLVFPAPILNPPMLFFRRSDSPQT